MFLGAARNTPGIRHPHCCWFWFCFRCSPRSNADSRKPVGRILTACVISLCSLLGAVSFDLSSSLETWRTTGKALEELVSCDKLWAVRLYVLQEERHSEMNTSFHARLLGNLNSLCKASEAEPYCENCQCKKEKISICRFYITDRRQKLNSTGDAEANQVLSRAISESLERFSLQEDLRAMRYNPDWADIVAFKLILQIREATLKAHLMPASPGLQTTLHPFFAILNYAVFSSENVRKCWMDNVNLSLQFTHYEGISFFIPSLGSDEFVPTEALAKGLHSAQSCLLQRGQEKLVTKSNEILVTLSLKISLLVVACLIYPIILMSFKQMTDWIHNYARNLKEKTEDLKRERRLAEDLLHQMLPKSVAKQLRKCQKVEAENYDEVSKWKGCCHQGEKSIWLKKHLPCHHFEELGFVPIVQCGWKSKYSRWVLERAEQSAMRHVGWWGRKKSWNFQKCSLRCQRSYISMFSSLPLWACSWEPASIIRSWAHKSKTEFPPCNMGRITKTHHKPVLVNKIL